VNEAGQGVKNRVTSFHLYRLGLPVADRLVYAPGRHSAAHDNGRYQNKSAHICRKRHLDEVLLVKRCKVAAK
jgi:hypothetical protein